MTWADVLVVATLAVAFWGGYRNGAVRELVGVVAILAAWIVAGSLAGGFGVALQERFGLTSGLAHLAAFWSLFLIVFAATRALGWLAERVLRRPVLRTASGIVGGFVASGKAVLLLWLILFIALFFPMSKDVRGFLRTSPTVATIEALDQPAFAMIRESLPSRARPFASLILAHHRL